MLIPLQDPDRSQLQLIRLRTTENEVIIAPGKEQGCGAPSARLHSHNLACSLALATAGEGCTLVVLQNPNKVKKVETKAEVAEEK